MKDRALHSLTEPSETMSDNTDNEVQHPEVTSIEMSLDDPESLLKGAFVLATEMGVDIDTSKKLASTFYSSMFIGLVDIVGEQQAIKLMDGLVSVLLEEINKVVKHPYEEINKSEPESDPIPSDTIYH